MISHYHVILAVGAFIVNNNKRLLIVKKSPHEAIDAGLWTIPGGKVYVKEPIIDALKREVNEEVGLTISSYQWIGEDVFKSNGFHYHAQHFLCHSLNHKIKLEKKLLEYRWITQDKINNYEFPINIKKRIISIFKTI